MPSQHPRGAPARSLRALLAALALMGGLIAAPSVSATPSQSDVAAAMERLQELESEGESLVEEYNLVHEELTQIQIRIGQTEIEVQTITRRMGGREDAAVDLARELYMGGTSGAIEAVLSSQTISEVESRLEYLRTSRQAQTRVFENLAVDRAELDRHMRELEEDRTAAAAAEAKLVDLREQVQARIDSQKGEIARLNRQIEAAAERERARLAAEAAAAIAAQEAASGPIPEVAAPNPSAQTAVDSALSQLGKPYVWAAAGPDSYDCSGLTMWAWSQAGVSLPHNSGMQYAATPRVAQSDWAPGDLLFFGSPIHHVSMYIGDGQMVEAPYSGSEVRIASAYRSDYVGAGRPGV